MLFSYSVCLINWFKIKSFNQTLHFKNNIRFCNTASIIFCLWTITAWIQNIYFTCFIVFFSIFFIAFVININNSIFKNDSKFRCLWIIYFIFHWINIINLSLVIFSPSNYFSSFLLVKRETWIIITHHLSFHN